jgi:AraC-type DNA-binding domain-containing proteins
MLTSFETSMIRALYDYSRIPLWFFDNEKKLKKSAISGISDQGKDLLSDHIRQLLYRTSSLEFDIMCYENELYFVFDFIRQQKNYYLLGGPMLLSGFYHVMEMKTLSFADKLNSSQLKALVENLPVVSISSFSSFLRIVILLLKDRELSLEEIRNYPFSKLEDSFQRTFLHELFEHAEDMSLHTPYSHELALLNCVKEGNLEMLESTYRTLPQIRYGDMSNIHTPMRQLFYGSIANTTLITRYAIEGGLEEETAFTLSDVYIKQMEKCRTLYELNHLNEKMAADFTERVAKTKETKKPVYSKVISNCMDYICKNINKKITLDMLAQEVHLTPKYISCLFRKETGQTISSFIENQKIEKAKNLLRYSQYSYSDISHYLSYYSQSYFISAFKKSVGMTPKEFRLKFSTERWSLEPRGN